MLFTQASLAASAWRQTDLDLPLALTFVNDQLCASSSQYHQSCLNALAAAGVATVQNFDTVSFEAQLQQALVGRSSQEVLARAINAHLTTFDPFASLKPAGAPSRMNHGIGVVASQMQDGLLVREVVDGTPAAKAGVQVGDRLTVEPDGRFTWRPKGQPPQSLALLAVDYELQNLSSYFEGEQLFIKIRHFDTGICGQVRTLLQHSRSARGLVIDVRGDPGGDLDEAICLATVFVGPRKLVGTTFAGIQIPEKNMLHIFDDSTELNWQVGSSLVENTISQVVVLVDGHTASSAELFAGILQYYAAAWIVGQRTFGKGTVQTTQPLRYHQQILLTATTGRFFLPNQMSDENVGITPSFAVADAPGEEVAMAREIDLFPTALPALNVAWSDPRQAQIAQMQPFILAHLQPAPDPQKAFALAILRSSPAPSAQNGHAVWF